MKIFFTIVLAMSAGLAFGVWKKSCASMWFMFFVLLILALAFRR